MKRIIKERLHPSIFSWGYLALQSIVKSLMKFVIDVKKEDGKRVLDLGCGFKPYEKLFAPQVELIGFDVEKNERVDFVGLNWNLPFKESEFDALISTQVLEHTAKLVETVSEIRRVVKPNGLVYISAPFAFPVHGAPYDFYRFTEYGLRELFKDFEIIEIQGNTGYFSTIIRLINVFLNYVPYSRIICAPLFFLNNSLAILLDSSFSSLGKISFFRNAYKDIYMGFPENYYLIARNKK